MIVSLFPVPFNTSPVTKLYEKFFLSTTTEIFPVVMTAVHGGLIENGKFSAVFINLLVLVMLAVIGIVMLVRARLDRNEDME